MTRRFSVADARAQLPSLLDAVEDGEQVEITRRGEPVAVVLSLHEYERLKGAHTGFLTDFRRWREGVQAEDLAPAEVFERLRDRSPGRKVRL
jgi:prevent-host-death family protein